MLSSEGKFFGRIVHVQLVCTVLCAVFGLVCSYQIRMVAERLLLAQVQEVQRYTDPEQPASPLNVRVPTSPSSEGSRRPVLGNGGLFQGKGGCLGFGGNTVPVGPVEAFAQGSATVGGPGGVNVAGQVLGSNAQFGTGCVGTGMGNVAGQAFGGVAASVTQQSNVPVSPLYQQLGFSGRTDGSQQTFLQPGSCSNFGCGVFGQNSNGSVPYSEFSRLQQQQQFLQQQSQAGIPGYPPGMTPGVATGMMSSPMGPSLGGFTPQQEAMRQIENLLGGLNPLQLRALSEVVTSQRALQSRGLPEVFGQVPAIGSGFDFGGFSSVEAATSWFWSGSIGRGLKQSRTFGYLFEE